MAKGIEGRSLSHHRQSGEAEVDVVTGLGETHEDDLPPLQENQSTPH